jgi:hypothetical protein
MICQVCQGPHRTAVDDALMTGASVREIASRFVLSKSGVGRHRTACLQPKLAAAARIVAPAAAVRGDVERAKAIVAGQVAANHDDILSLTGLLERLARSLERLEGAADSAASESQHMPLAALSGQLHRGIESAAKIQGLYAEPKPPGVAGFSLSIVLPAGEPMKPGLRNVTPSQADPTDAEPVTLHLRFHEPAG